jgi:hypothetical protein
VHVPRRQRVPGRGRLHAHRQGAVPAKAACTHAGPGAGRVGLRRARGSPSGHAAEGGWDRAGLRRVRQLGRCAPALRWPLPWGDSMPSETVLLAGDAGTSGVARPDDVPIWTCAPRVVMRGGPW